MIQKNPLLLCQIPRIYPWWIRSHPPSRAAAESQPYRLKTREHSVTGVQYKIITDHSQKNYLKALERLAEHHHGEVIRINSLRELSSDKTSEKLQTQLRGAKFVAIAPRIESFTEGMLLDVWALLCGIDEDSLMDVWPGLLIASDAQAFEKLIDQSIEQVDLAGDEIRPLAISQVRNRRETRSLQKAGVPEGIRGKRNRFAGDLHLRQRLRGRPSTARAEDMESKDAGSWKVCFAISGASRKRK